jgi:hypothetical protein
MRSLRLVASLVAYLLVFSTFIWGQGSTTSLRGTVSDSSGATVPKAEVTLTNPERAFQHTATTGPAGEYEFLQVPPGTYQLVVEIAGFRKSDQRDIQLLVNTPATVNVTLAVGAASETVQVTAEAALVNAVDASLGNAFNEHQVKELPLEGRNVPDLLSLQAGVTYTGNRADIDRNVDTRSGAVNGAHSDQSNITLDGVDVNDQVNGYAFTTVLPVTLDSVQEFRVTTSNYNADQGRSSGAQVSLVTKSGTNSFHGSLYEYHRNTATSANDYFVKQSELSTGQSNQPLKLIRNIFGASFGGPIIKDRLFVFLNYEGSRQREEHSVVRIVPSDSLRDGVILYQCDPTDLPCPGGTIQGISGPHTVPVGFNALNKQDLTGIDPLHIGPNSIMLNYFNGFPHANDVSQGDGYNFQGYRFRGPFPTSNNWYIARVDYKITNSGNHTIFWRGALRNDGHSDVPYLPGTAPLQTIVDFSKGFTVGYTAALRPTLVNAFHWGYTRQSFGVSGNNNTQPFIFFRGLNDNSTSNNSSLSLIRSRNYQTPVNNFVDDVSWSKGKHTLQFGTNIRFIRNPRSSFLTSFPDGFTNSSGLASAGIADTGTDLDPAATGLPAVDSGFANSYDYPLVAMMGIVSQLDASYNFTKTGAVLPEGAAVNRRWGADEYEFYIQDSYRVKPNLTINYGLRYGLFSPPWETGGTEVAPTISMGQWFKDRGNRMLQGLGSKTDPTVSFDLSGAANGKKGYYGWDYHNFAPRLAFSYSPRPEWGWLKSLVGEGDKTVIRGGFGMVYDRIGAGLLSTFDQRGSFGLSTQLSNALAPTVSTAPRLTGLNTIPTQGFPPPPTPGFPYTPPPGGTGLAIYWGLDDTIKTPYSYSLDFSIGRELPKNMSIEVSYVGHLSRRLLAQEDLAMPLDIVDPKSKIDYFAAAHRLSELGFAGTPTSSITPALVGPTAAYWQNMIAPLQPGDQYLLGTQAFGCGSGSTTDPVRAMYALMGCGGGPVNGYGDETTPLFELDSAGADYSGTAGIQGTSGAFYPSILGPNAYFNKQFHSLYAWRSVANANYNAMQVNFRKRLSHGLQFDFNYTYSKSIDLESDAERVDAYSGLGSQIINAWSPNQGRGVSGFDTTHQFNLNWIAELPFGKGKMIAGDAGGRLNGFIGGWQFSGLARWTSGFPIRIDNGGTWPTNWQLEGDGFLIGHAHTSTTKNPDGTVNLFPDPQGPTGLGAFRNDMPGESGTRNVIRGPGYAGLDAGLSKRWQMPYAESHSVQFRWEVFNVLNLTRFDVQSITNNLDAGPAFGNFSGLLTNPRVMQFALRYEF